MGLPLLEELIEFREDKVIFGNAMAPDGTELKNIPVDGQLYDLVINGGYDGGIQGKYFIGKRKRYGCAGQIKTRMLISKKKESEKSGSFFNFFLII